MLRSLEATFERIDDKGLLEEVKNEIAYNLFELKNIFASKSPKLKFDALNAVKSSKFQNFVKLAKRAI